MRILQLLLISVIIFALTTRASVIRPDVEDFDDSVDSFENALKDDNDGGDHFEDIDDPENLPIASIKSRAIAMDRELCRELSRYHPHYPRCQLYCEKLNHWIGMCRRDSCHCYS
ncbi:hypothetical protein FF38_05302 [Lucilia cuprina]|uniref:Invertebrate defensins family profile domain-containing protein n=1 Tax=Lucilia cuprina TaxID=7375 RepID=A0A0L0BRJ2_LUCCU|nr:hypothetical protein CVS40_4210 [Lucilia cuprina]KNC22657.1 hypothetical protein FF38_05302 [Lucilia cuprina]